MSMTENKAKDYMENEIRCIQRASYCDRDCAKCYLVKEEEESLLEAFGVAIKALEEIQQYRAIGTVEAFKALKEKTEPKKPDIEKFWGYDDLMCPGCKSYFVGEPKYCCKCGQAIDWQ